MSTSKQLFCMFIELMKNISMPK